MPIDDLASMRSWQNTHNTETDTKNNISVVGAITVLNMPVSLSVLFVVFRLTPELFTY